LRILKILNKTKEFLEITDKLKSYTVLVVMHLGIELCPLILALQLKIVILELKLYRL